MVEDYAGQFKFSPAQCDEDFLDCYKIAKTMDNATSAHKITTPRGKISVIKRKDKSFASPKSPVDLVCLFILNP